MKMVRVVHLFFAAALGVGAQEVPEPAADEVIRIESLADDGAVFYDTDTGLVVVTNAFVARFRDVTLTANQGEYERDTGRVRLEGDVFLQRQNQAWRGDRLEYNLLTREVSGDAFRTGRPPYFAAGEGLEADPTNQTYTARGATLTPDDLYRPGVKIRARSIRIAPGKYFEVRHAVFYAAGVPFFYLPYARYNLEGASNHFTLIPGYRTSYGGFVLGGYDWVESERLRGTLHLDYRVKRGVGLGPDVLFDSPTLGQGDFRFYYLHDLDPGLTSVTNTTPVPDDRYRLNFTDLAQIRTNLNVRLALRMQSDPYVLRDFFEPEYRENPQPSTFAEVSQWWRNFSLNLIAQPQVNDFFETVERLPELKLTGERLQLFRSPLYYESDSAVGYYERAYTEDSGQTNYSAFRADTYHQLLLPVRPFGWLNFIPRAGGRYTYYGETHGEGATLTEESRWVFNTGAELSFKASRVWPEIEVRALEVDGLRHIVEPSFNYVFVPEPTVLPPQLPQFDTNWPSLVPLSIQFPDYNAIDAIDSQNVLRLGLRNKVQTKRNGEVDNLLDWDLLIDWRLNPAPLQPDFSDLYSRLDFKPRSWLTFTSDVRLDVEQREFQLTQHALTLAPGNTWSWAFGHRYVREDPALGFLSTDNLLLSSLYYRLNENWGVRFSHNYDLEDSVLEEQQYTVYRDFRSWTGALTFRVRDNGSEGTDYAVAFTFSLKAFPRYGVGDDRDKPSLLLGG